jgi:hypothetical protein
MSKEASKDSQYVAIPVAMLCFIFGDSGGVKVVSARRSGKDAATGW